MAELLPVSRQARRAVREVPEPLLVADRDAAVRPVAAAVDALAALRGEERDHVVAGTDERDALAHPLDDACALVAEHARRVAGRVGARGRVEVGVAHAARDEAHEHLARLRLREVDLLDRERPTELLEHGGADLHAPILRPARARRLRCLRGGVRQRGARRGRRIRAPAREVDDDRYVVLDAGAPIVSVTHPGAEHGTSSGRSVWLRSIERCNGDLVTTYGLPWLERAARQCSPVPVVLHFPNNLVDRFVSSECQLGRLDTGPALASNPVSHAPTAAAAHQEP